MAKLAQDATEICHTSQNSVGPWRFIRNRNFIVYPCADKFDTDWNLLSAFLWAVKVHSITAAEPATSFTPAPPPCIAVQPIATAAAYCHSCRWTPHSGQHGLSQCHSLAKLSEGMRCACITPSRASHAGAPHSRAAHPFSCSGCRAVGAFHANVLRLAVCAGRQAAPVTPATHAAEQPFVAAVSARPAGGATGPAAGGTRAASLPAGFARPGAVSGRH